MLKSTSTPQKSPEEFISYPCLMQIKSSSITNSKTVVLLHKEKSGVVIYKGDSEPYLIPYPVGYFSIGWNMACLEPYHGSITIDSY